MADETPVTPAPPTSDSIPITDPTASQSIPIDLNPEYDPAKDTRAPFLKVNPNPTGPTIEAAHKPILQRVKEAATENIPRFSNRTSSDPNYGKESLLPDSDIMSAQEKRDAPVLAGGLDVASELATPATISTIAATAGLGEAPAIVSKVASALFAGQIATSVYEQYPALKAAVDKAQHAKSKAEHDDAFADAQRLMTHMGADTLMGLLAAKHGAEGAKSILDATTGSGVPDQASTFKSPGKAPAAIEPEETHPEMNRQTVKDLQGLGYSNQHITNFNIGEIRDILKNQTPAAEHPVSKTAAPAGPDPEALAAEGGKLVSHQPAVSTSAETPASVEKPVSGVEKTSEVEDPAEAFIMSEKIKGKTVRGATPKQLGPAPPDALAEHNGKFVGNAPEPAAPAYHPDLQKLVDMYGTHQNPALAAKEGRGSFILPDGKFTTLPAGVEHLTAIARATGRKSQGATDNRVGFLNDTQTIRVRPNVGRSGASLQVDVPKDGVTPEQVDALKQTVGKQGRNGEMVMGTAEENPYDSKTADQEFVTPAHVDDMLRKVQAHPDQKDIVQSDKQAPYKEKYGMEVTDPDGTTHVEKVAAYSNNEAMKAARKKFPDAGIMRLPEHDEAHVPSTEYSVPTKKSIKMPESGDRPEADTDAHEMAHGLVALDEKLGSGGIITQHHPTMPKDARAAHLLPSAGLRGPDGKILPDKRRAVLKSGLAGIASDEIRGLHRSANPNFDITDDGDGGNAYDILKEAGFTHEAALKEMHKLIDENIEYLKHPAVSSVVNENIGVRENDLSKQYHHSAQQLQNMHAETERRKANGYGTGTNNPASDEATAPGSQEDVAEGKGGISKTDNGPDQGEEEGIVSEEKRKPKDPLASVIQENTGFREKGLSR